MTKITFWWKISKIPPLRSRFQMLPLFERDCSDAKGLFMPQLTDSEISKSLTLKDIEAICNRKTMQKYKAVVLFNEKDEADKAFR